MSSSAAHLGCPQYWRLPNFQEETIYSSICKYTGRKSFILKNICAVFKAFRRDRMPFKICCIDLYSLRHIYVPRHVSTKLKYILEYDPSNFNFSRLRLFLALGFEGEFRCLLLTRLIRDVLSIEDFQEETPYIYICKAVFANTRGESPSYYNILVRYVQRFIEIECLPKFATLIHIRHCPDVFLQNSNILEYDPSNFSSLTLLLGLELFDEPKSLRRRVLRVIRDVLSIEDFQEETVYIYM